MVCNAIRISLSSTVSPRWTEHVGLHGQAADPSIRSLGKPGEFVGAGRDVLENVTTRVIGSGRNGLPIVVCGDGPVLFAHGNDRQRSNSPPGVSCSAAARGLCHCPHWPVPARRLGAIGTPGRGDPLPAGTHCSWAEGCRATLDRWATGRIHRGAVVVAAMGRTTHSRQPCRDRLAAPSPACLAAAHPAVRRRADTAPFDAVQRSLARRTPRLPMRSAWRAKPAGRAARQSPTNDSPFRTPFRSGFLPSARLERKLNRRNPLA